MDILEKINDPIEQEKYILEKVSESDRDIVRAALTY
jgi:hypothetical protein